MHLAIISADIFLFDVSFRAGAGHWLVAYRKAEEQKYTSLLQRTKKKDGGADTPRSNTLDGPFLVRT